MQVQGRTGAVLVILTSTAAICALLGSAVPARSSQSGEPGVTGELIVGFKGDTARSEVRSVARSAQASVTEELPSIDGAVLTTSDPQATKQQLEELPEVDYVEPNHVLKAMRVPNDRYFGEQWGMRNLGQLGGESGADIGATGAWDVSTGANVTVAVIDTGVDYTHPDLDANTWNNPGEVANGIDDDHNGFVDDVNGVDFVNGDNDPSDDAGHGTHVAGVIGAEGNNGLGIAGVNWNAKLMPLKFLDSEGEGNTADAAMAIDYAVEHGARVINASWGGPAFSQTLYEAVRRAGDQGVLFVAAAGNEGQNSDGSPDYPAAFDLPNVISVAASDRYDRLLSYSNYGPHSVDLAAPGDDVFSTVPDSVEPSRYASFSGTSMAAPSVAGAAALYISHSPGAATQQTKSAMLASVDRKPAFAGRILSGGRLNVGRMMGAGEPQGEPALDRTAPSAFRLKRPRNRYASARRAIRFKWQRARDATGIRYYRLFVDGRRVKTIRDGDGPGGHEPRTKTKVKLRSGRHKWYVKAYDYSGNVRRSKRSRKSRGRARSSRSLYIGKRYRKYASKRHSKLGRR